MNRPAEVGTPLSMVGHLTVDDATCDLDVTTDWPGLHALHAEPDLLDQQRSRRARGHQLASLQALPVERGKRDQVSLLAVVRDDRQSRSVRSCPRTSRAAGALYVRGR